MIQLQFINYILDTKDSSLITLNNLNDNYFDNYKSEWNFISNHLKKYGIIPDKETFMSNFPEFDLTKVNESPSYLIEELFKDYQTRQLASTFNDVRVKLMEGELDKAVNIYRNAYEKISTGISLQSIDILRDTSRYNKYIEKTQNFDKYYISTGFPELDSIIGGWDREEELATIVARTNMGKSYIAIKMALAAAEQGLNVGYYSGEMSEVKVGYRIDTLSSHLSNGSLIHGNNNIQNEYKKFIDKLPTKYSGSIKVLTPKMINGPAGVNALRVFIEKENLDILFVDQHSLLEDDRGAKNPVEKASNISKDLKNLQVMKRIPIISVSQQNRTTTEDKLSNTTQIAQSDRIGQDSTIILFLEKKENLMKLTLGKSRDSENNKTLSYNVDFNTGTFIYIPSDEKDVKSNEDYEHKYEKEKDLGENEF